MEQSVPYQEGVDRVTSRYQNDDNITPDEIGDLCNFQATQLGGYNVQEQWSNIAGACLIAPPVGS